MEWVTHKLNAEMEELMTLARESIKILMAASVFVET